jgi:hypothetical protein
VKMANTRGPESLKDLAANTGAIPVSVEPAKRVTHWKAGQEAQTFLWKFFLFPFFNSRDP